MNNISAQPKGGSSKIFLRLLIWYLGLSALVLTFFVGYFMGSSGARTGSGIKILTDIVDEAPSVVKNQDLDYGLYWDVWKYMADEYIGQPIDEKAAFYGSLKGMVASLNDPYSIFLDPEESREFDIEISGQFEGVGAEIGIKDEQLVVISPLSGSPAEKAGLKAGDAIIKIDDLDTSGLSVDQAVQYIRGEKGTTVNLYVLHEDESEPVTVSIVRDTINTISVDWEMLDDDIAYLNVASFSTDTITQLSPTINEMLLKQPQGLILDLRGNPGGYLDVAVEVAGEFIIDDVVVIEEFSNGRQQSYKADGQHRLYGIPTVVLVGPGTASAAEILAGALQDYNLATLVGETTFGKGLVQDYTEFDDGSSLKISVAKWLTPNSRSIHETGITPDIMVEYEYEDYQAGIDPQLDRALEVLNSE